MISGVDLWDRGTLTGGAEGSVRVEWLGTAGFAIEHQGTALLIDPYLTRASMRDCVLGALRPDAVAIARGILYDPHWPWHAAAALGAQVLAPKQYWRSQPRGMSQLFGDVRIGMR